MARLSARSSVVNGAIGFVACLAVCARLQPGSIGGNDGICIFDGHEATFIPYFLGFVFAATGLIAASRRSAVGLLRQWLFGLGVLMMLTALPHGGSGWASAIHMVVGCTLFGFAALLGVVATFTPRRLGLARPTWALPSLLTLALSLGATASAGWWVVHVNGHLTWAQLAFLVAVLANYCTWLPNGLYPEDCHTITVKSEPDRVAPDLP